MALNSEFESIVGEMPLLLERLCHSAPLLPSDIREQTGPGVYCFFENGLPLYLGRTSNLRNRHRNHCGASSKENTAAFAFLLTREATANQRASYKKFGSRKDLMRDVAFSAEFECQKNRIKSMEIRFVEIDCPNTQHIFEVYASLKLRTPYNKFTTT